MWRLGLHVVTLRDASGQVLDIREVVVLPDEAVEVTFTLNRQVPTETIVPQTATVPPTAVPTSTSMAVSGLPNNCHGTSSGAPVLALMASLIALVTASSSYGDGPVKIRQINHRRS